MFKKCKTVILTGTAVADLLLAGLFYAYTASLKTPAAPPQLTDQEQTTLTRILDTTYPERTELLHPLPYKTVPAQLDIKAENAILIDTATGNILFEKDADRQIPPASMTKLVVMYVVFQEIAEGHLSLTDVVPLPPESYARNLPKDSSLMFLDEGQNVTLEELLTGLAVDSGNDAAIAVALYVSGSISKFVDRMNDLVKSFGLTHTHFVEPSGYSEKNITTPREFAAFSRKYVSDFPEEVEKFDARRKFSYPLAHNLPASQAAQGDSQAITQYNTNKLLGLLDGCDGLKTGFIYESGYNLTLTAQRNGTRFLSVTMKGPGIGSAQGNRGRIHDGTTLMEWAFSSFADYHEKENRNYIIAVPGAKKSSVNLIPSVGISALTVPFIDGKSPQDAASSVRISVKLPASIVGGTRAGTVYGSITYQLHGTILKQIPLVADRDIKKAVFPVYLVGKAAALFLD